MWTIKASNKGSSLLDCLLRNIKCKNTEDINEWFRKSLRGDYIIKNLAEAAKYLEENKNTPIHIVGDYDVDGVAATAICVLGLRMAGFTNISYRIPRRFSEGYGLNTSIVDEIEHGILLTVDNGIAALDAIAKAKAKGLYVILTDHHLPVKDNGKVILPDADIIIDPHLDESALFDDYCGAGIAYRLMNELNHGDKKCKTLLRSLAAIATIADCVSLQHENYVIVKQGLATLPTYCLSGMKALLQTLNISIVSSEDVGFKIGPCLNAPGRLYDDGANKALELLLYNGDFPLAVQKAESLQAVNDVRKGLVSDAVAAAEQFIEDECLYGDKVFSIYLDNICEGILGIVAGRICEKYHVPSFVFTNTEEGIYKGSGRSTDYIHLKNLLDEVKTEHPDVFIKCGGHAAAAGLSIKSSSFYEFKDFMNDYCPAIISPIENDISFYDFEIKEEDIPKTLELVKKFEPFGNGNPAPIFKIENFRALPSMGKMVNKLGVSGIKIIGKESTVIGFNNPGLVNSSDSYYTVYGTLGINYFRGTSTPTVTAIDVVPESAPTIKTTSFAALIAEMAEKR